MPIFMINDEENGTRHPIEAATREEAIAKAEQMVAAGQVLPTEGAPADTSVPPAAGAPAAPAAPAPAANAPAPVTASGLGKSALTGLRDTVGGIAGAVRDVPEQVGRGAGWLAKQANQVMPDSMQADPGAVSDAISTSMSVPSDKLIKALILSGVLPKNVEDELAQFLNPTTQQVQEGISQTVNQATGQGTHQGVGGAGVAPAPRSTFDELTRHDPENIAESLTRTGAGFAGDALFPGSVPARIARVLAPAGATEVAGQTAKAAGADPEVESAIRMLTGLATGGITNSVERGRQAMDAARVVRERPGALSKLATALDAQGMTVDDLQHELSRLGPEGTLMDTGSQMSQLGQKVHSKPGPGRTAIDEKLKTREAGANERIDQGIRTNVGPRVSRPDTLEALEQRRSSIGQEYQGAYGQQSSKADVQPILDEIDADIGATKDKAIRKQLRDVRDSLFEQDKDGNPTNVLDETDRGLHGARKLIDNKMKDQSGKPRDIGGEEGVLLSKYRERIDAQLKGSSPAIKDIDTRYSQVKKEERAFDTGETFLDRGNHPLSPEEAQKHWDSLSSGEKDHLAKGLTHKLDETTGLSDNDRVAVKRWLGGSDKNSYNFQKLGTVIGPEKAQAVIDMMSREATFQRTYQRTIENSKTAETQDLDIDKPSAAGEIVRDTVKGAGAGAAVGHPVAGAAAGATHGVLGRMTDKLVEMLPGTDLDRASLGRMLSSGRHDDLTRALQLLGTKKSLPPPLLQALLARQEELGNR